MSLTKDQRSLIDLDKELQQAGIIDNFKKTTKVEQLLQQFLSLDESIKLIKNQIVLLSPTELPVLLIGETGVGKELLAKALHSDRVGKFIGVNAGGVPENLLESEFFGYNKGAFTGASNNQQGYFDLAVDGTLFLDEIGELPRLLQCKLLRALQEKYFYRVGGKEKVAFNCRIISATNNTSIIDKNIFRDDLYYRLAGSVLHIKPLRERPSDIELIVKCRINIQEHIDKFHEHYKHNEWKGNVRQLLNAIEEYKILNSIK